MSFVRTASMCAHRPALLRRGVLKGVTGLSLTGSEATQLYSPLDISKRKAYVGKAACGLCSAIFDMTGGGPEENSCAVLGPMPVAFCKIKW